VRLRTCTRPGWVVLKVEDNGPGIARDLVDRIFEPFTSTKPATAGAGLGLSICAGIARDHGGSIRLEPRALGACVVVELPVHTGGPEASAN